MPLISVFVSHKSFEEARKITDHLLKQRLIACSTTFPSRSSFWWQGKIEHQEEVVSILKTKQENWEKLKVEITKIHPFKVPAIIKYPVEANKVYEDWVQKEVQ